MRHRQRPAVGALLRATLRAAWALVIIAVALQVPLACAGDLNSPLELDIPTQSLASALTVLASRADLQILVSQELIAGKTSPPIRGRYSGLEALQRMLGGAGLEYSVTGRDTVVVRARRPAAASTPPAGPPAQAKAKATHGPRPADTDASVPEEIVVTAQKRRERLQDVPLAVVVVNAAELADRQINETDGLVQMVPALNYQPGNNPTNSTFRIRGVGTALFGQGTESSVSLVVDGVVQARQAQSFADLADIERIEVLEGPQGTLFGKNATGGVINVITAQPDHTFGGAAAATIAAQDEYRLKGTVTGPINDTLAYRVSGYYNNAGGWIHDIATGGDYGGTRSYGWRGKLSWDATDRLNVLLAAEYRDSYHDCCHIFPIVLVNPTLIALYRPLVVTRDNTSNEENVHSDSDSQQITTSLTATYELEWAELTSISAFQSFHLRNNVDVDSLDTPTPIFVGLQTPNYGKFDVNGGSVDLGNFTQEVRLASRDHARVGYVAGLYYSTLLLNRPFQFRRAVCLTGELGEPCAAPIYQSAADNAHLNSGTFAAFGQVEYPLSGALQLIGGVREQRDRIFSRGITYTPSHAADASYPGYTTNWGGAGFTNIATSGKAGLQYGFSRNSQAYATYTRGYKGVGAMTEISSNWTQLTPILPETVDAYEVGYKGRLFGGHLVVAADAFLARYDNLQVQANRSNFITGTNNFVPTNAGSSRTRGLELQLTYRPGRQFSLDASIIYDEATFDMNGLDCPLQFQAAAPVIAPGGPRPINTCYNPQTHDGAGALVDSGPIQDVRDRRLPASPLWRGMLSARYERSLAGNLEGFAQVDVTAQSAVQMALEQDPLLVQPAYALTNLTLGVRPPNERYQVTFFVRNVFDRRYFTTLVHTLDLAGTANPYDVFAWRPKDASRYVGGTVSVRF
jgi:iron complex outermembrane recepter protein